MYYSTSRSIKWEADNHSTLEFMELLVYEFWRTDLTASIVQNTVALGVVVLWRE